MVRTSTSLAVISGFALMLGLAGTANATNSVDLVWKANGLTTIGSTAAAPPPSLEASLVITGDANGIAGVAGGFVFDYMGQSPANFVGDGDELNARGALLKENAGAASKGPGMSNQFAPLQPANQSLLQESGSGQHGVIRGFDSATLGPGCTSGAGCVLTLGSALFTTTANTSSDSNPDVIFSIQINGSDGILDALTNTLTTNNTFGTVNVLPEPMAGVFGVAALGALGLLARRRS